MDVKHFVKKTYDEWNKGTRRHFWPTIAIALLLSRRADWCCAAGPVSRYSGRPDREPSRTTKPPYTISSESMTKPPSKLFMRDPTSAFCAPQAVPRCSPLAITCH
jgi:hypothetical protein